METYRVEINPDAVSGGDEGDLAFEFQCGPHMQAFAILQELFVPGVMSRLLIATNPRGKLIVIDPMWKEVGSFDKDNLFVAK